VEERERVTEFVVYGVISDGIALDDQLTVEQGRNNLRSPATSLLFR
jgi:hypothetical protein